ncbi:hypothetical protein EDD15DRAFT_757450 [Pisolithus albus]|nr:hypothetical protein EDD15DRAFT_757450 [Pisolithus albus]
MTSRLWTPSSHRAAHYYDARLTIGTSVNTSAPPEWAHLLSIVVMTSVDSTIHGSPCEVADGNNSRSPLGSVGEVSLSPHHRSIVNTRSPGGDFCDSDSCLPNVPCFVTPIPFGPRRISTGSPPITRMVRSEYTVRSALALVFRTIMGQTYVLRTELGELPSEPSTKCLRCVHRYIRGSHSGMVVRSKILYCMHRETIDSAACHTTTRATRLSPLHSTKYICLATLFVRQSQSTSVVGCSPDLVEGHM